MSPLLMRGNSTRDNRRREGKIVRQGTVLIQRLEQRPSTAVRLTTAEGTGPFNYGTWSVLVFEFHERSAVILLYP